MAKPIVRSERADADVRQAIQHFARDAGAHVALEFVAALEATYRRIGEHPKIGSPRYSHELRLPGLRHQRLRRYPWLVFYMEHKTRIDVWRVLDARRDIPAWLEDSGEA